MEFDKAVAELDALVKTLEREGDERALLALQLVDAIHRPAIEALAAGDRDDPRVRAVLAMYEVEEFDLDADVDLVQQALTTKRPVYADAGEAAALEPGRLKVAVVEDMPVLLANVEGDIFALRDGCPLDGRTLEGGRLTGTVLVCPWHNCAYDVRSGKRLDDEPDAESLAVVPVAIRDGSLKVAVDVA